MAIGQKHLVPCRCVLTQFRQSTNPPRHHFTVFSVIDDDDKVVPKFSQCNNCGLVHKVTDLCMSEIVQGKEHMPSLLTIDDIKTSLPKNICDILESNDADLATWEMARFIIENKRWGDFVVISSESESGAKQGKYVRILSETMFKVETFYREESVK